MRAFVLLLVGAFLAPISVQAQSAYAVLLDNTLTFYYDDAKDTRLGNPYDVNAGQPAWTGKSQAIRKVVFDISFANARPTTTFFWFANMSSLTEIEGLEHLNTADVTTMQAMFMGCGSLVSLDLSTFDTSNVTNMGDMFLGCESLANLNLRGVNTSNVQNMANMFTSCKSLVSLDLSGFNTVLVTSMSNMFSSCYKLVILNLSSFNTESVTSMSGMFSYSTSLAVLDLSSFDTGKVTDTSHMFQGCTSLATVYCREKWSTRSINSSVAMFSDCKKLVGGSGTAYDPAHTDARYAHIDGGAGAPGYLTYSDPASVKALSPDGRRAQGPWYMPQGIRVAAPSVEGLYIRHGKKIIVGNPMK